MFDFKVFQERLGETEGIEIQSVLDFMNEMGAAETSAFFNEDRKNKYRSLDFASIMELMAGGNGSSIRVNLIAGSLSTAPGVVSQNSDDYF